MFKAEERAISTGRSSYLLTCGSIKHRLSQVWQIVAADCTCALALVGSWHTQGGLLLPPPRPDYIYIFWRWSYPSPHVTNYTLSVSLDKHTHTHTTCSTLVSLVGRWINPSSVNVALVFKSVLNPGQEHSSSTLCPWSSLPFLVRSASSIFLFSLSSHSHYVLFMNECS